MANLRFDQTKNQTSDQLNQISLNGRDKVRESFQKYLDDQHNGMPIKSKILRQMAEAGEVPDQQDSAPEIEIELDANTGKETTVAKEVLEHPDSIEKQTEDSPTTNKISEVVIIGLFSVHYWSHNQTVTI